MPVVESLHELWQVQALKEEREAACRREARLQALQQARQQAEKQLQQGTDILSERPGKAE